MPIRSIFISNRSGGGTNRIGLSHIRLGNDSADFSTINSIVVPAIVEGGFFEVNDPISGRYINVRRDQPSVNVSDNGAYNLRQIKVYQTPNLIKTYEDTIQITSDTSTAVTEYEAVNLIQNLENRSSWGHYYAISVYDPLDHLLQRTCYRVNYGTIKSQSNKIILGFDFGEAVFIHAVLHAQDNLNAGYLYMIDIAYLHEFF